MFCLNEVNSPIPESFLIAKDIKNEKNFEHERYSYTEGQKVVPLSSSTFHTTNQAIFFPKENSSRLPPIQRSPDEFTSNITESHSAPIVSYLDTDIQEPLTQSSKTIRKIPSPSNNTNLPPVKELCNSNSTHNSSNENNIIISSQSIPLQSVNHPISVTKDWTPSLDQLAQHIFEQDPSILRGTIDADNILQRNSIHRIALFITMFCSILQSAFFSYVSSVSSNQNITLYLFFIRMFCDLVGRPLALVRPRIIFFQTITGVFVGTIFRALAMGFFFFYIFTPKDLIYRNDYMILIFQVSRTIYLFLTLKFSPISLFEQS